MNSGYNVDGEKGVRPPRAGRWRWSTDHPWRASDPGGRLLTQGALAAEYMVIMLSESVGLIADVLQQPEPEAVA